jgi:hypothetical protein
MEKQTLCLSATGFDLEGANAETTNTGIVLPLECIQPNPSQAASHSNQISINKLYEFDK